MSSQDIFTFLKVNILKHSKFIFAAIIWFIIVPPLISIYLPSNTLDLSNSISTYDLYNDHDFWVIPFRVLIVAIWFVFFILCRELLDMFIHYTKRGTLYQLADKSWDKDWIYNGKVTLLSDHTPTLRVTSSRAGCLLKKYLWRNFEMKFHMKFINTEKHVGIIFRAKDLENYFMLEIIQKNEAVVIKPHVRYSGMWEIMSQDAIESRNILDWLKIHLKVKEYNVSLHIENIGNYSWRLPTHVDINHIEDGIRKNQNTNSSTEEEFAAKVTYLPEIEFRDSFGMIGFRAHLDQGADIKNLTVRDIRSLREKALDIFRLY